MGVPGAKSYHLVASGYGSAVNLSLGKANPYFVRFATSATTSVLADADGIKNLASIHYGLEIMMFFLMQQAVV